jgi:tousled-like kinase
LLGKGGFSEVWKAMDMTDLKEVAVKVHQLNPSWTEEKKHSYIKHVTREYTIHREMKHPRVVQLYEVFEIDVNSFATVLEYCRGIDLDEKLKRMKFIPEKDAKAILLQILSGLKYLNTPSDISPSVDNGAHPREAVSSRRKAVIHFDLKPANILFDEMGDAKITDFGLSKIIEDTMDNDATSLELTTQGAGTYWYLPPECFQAENSRISPKVDVWSLGVIYYQVLFGKRPFGDGKTQERVMSEGIMLNATKVEFPSASDPKNPNLPKVSEEAKDFIKYCLTWDQKLRPDINQLCMHPYVRNSK